MDGEREPGVLARWRAAGLRARRALGQNFLHDPSLLRSIVDLAAIGADDAVFEVGTGPGTLTRELARRAASVLTVELDPGAARFARSELNDLQNVTLLERDALGRGGRLDAEVERALRALGPFHWVSNLPYSVASPLIVATLEAALPWRSAVLTLQSEVVDRVRAGPGGREWGVLGLLVGFWASAERSRRIGAGSFWPRPSVESAVLRLLPREPPLPPSRYPVYRRWVHALFARRRKQLGSTLRRCLGKEAAEAALREGGWRPDLRAEALGVEDVARLAGEFDPESR